MRGGRGAGKHEVVGCGAAAATTTTKNDNMCSGPLRVFVRQASIDQCFSSGFGMTTPKPPAFRR